MSAGARWFLAVCMLLMGLSFAWVATLGTVAPAACWSFAIVCILIALVAVAESARPFAARILGAVVFCACLWYLASQLQQPAPTTLLTYKRSQPNLPNAIIAFIVFGLPGLYCAVMGNLGKAFYFKKP